MVLDQGTVEHSHYINVLLLALKMIGLFNPTGKSYLNIIYHENGAEKSSRHLVGKDC